MKPRILLWAVAAAIAIDGLRAAVPVIHGITVDTVTATKAVTFKATLTDTDNNLSYVSFYVSGPGLSGWHHVGGLSVSGGNAQPQQTWQASSPGYYTARVTAFDTNGSVSRDQIFEVYSSQLTVAPAVYQSGSDVVIPHIGEIITAAHASTPQVTVKNEGALVLWASGRIILASGFRAETGSDFWAAIDHNMNGYTDQEEAKDSDGDGLFDAWEQANGFSHTTAQSADLDGDGMSNYNELLVGRNPNDASDGMPVPNGFQLVLKLPGVYLGIKPGSLEASPVAGP